MTQNPTWLAEDDLQKLFAIVRAAGGELRVVGGAVRNFLIGQPGGDIDFASTLLPERMMELAQQQGWKAIPTGIDHGTVTLVLPTRVVEVTTLRRDVATDGRHAKVAYTDHFEEDAARRDFTINALYMDADGKIYDYFDGQKDLSARTVRFIGDAQARIREDGLRILRYFRFFARFGATADTAAVAACLEQKHMLSQLSGERIAAEMRKLMMAPAPLTALEQMAAIGLPALLTQAEWDCSRLRALSAYEREHPLAAHPLVRLVSLFVPAGRMEVARWIGERWKLSRAERKQLEMLSEEAHSADPVQVKAWLRKQERGVVIARILLASLDSDEALATQQLLQLAEDWDAPLFPIVAADLMAIGYPQGKDLGDTLRQLEEHWAQSDYQLGKEALLAEVKDPTA